MSIDVIRYSGDLKIAVRNSGTITLDTGVSVGKVVITGNLDVLGTQTNITSTNTNILDNIVVLNAGETNNYVTLGQAGIAIDRGNNASSTSSATLLYDDSISWRSKTTSTFTRGVWVFKSAGIRNGIEVGAVRFGSSSTVELGLSAGGAVSVKTFGVAGTAYAARIIDDDDIPNKWYVDNTPLRGTATTALSALEIRQGNTWVEANDDSVTGNPSNVTTFIDGVTTMIVRSNSVIAAGVAIIGNTIRPLTNNTNLTLQTQGTGTVVVNNGISIGVSSTAPLAEQGVVKVYTTSTPGAGSSGIMFTGIDNRNIPPTPIRGELISARKALVFSIIF
jgi:hypothetical protein